MSRIGKVPVPVPAGVDVALEGGDDEGGARRGAPRQRSKNDAPQATFRLEVGRKHGVLPGNIVGALAHEGDLHGTENDEAAERGKEILRPERPLRKAETLALTSRMNDPGDDADTGDDADDPACGPSDGAVCAAAGATNSWVQ